VYTQGLLERISVSKFYCLFSAPYASACRAARAPLDAFLEKPNRARLFLRHYRRLFCLFEHIKKTTLTSHQAAQPPDHLSTHYQRLFVFCLL
jgi:hypothetical protein